MKTLTATAARSTPLCPEPTDDRTALSVEQTVQPILNRTEYNYQRIREIYAGKFSPCGVSTISTNWLVGLLPNPINAYASQSNHDGPGEVCFSFPLMHPRILVSAAWVLPPMLSGLKVEGFGMIIDPGDTHDDLDVFNPPTCSLWVFKDGVYTQLGATLTDPSSSVPVYEAEHVVSQAGLSIDIGAGSIYDSGGQLFLKATGEWGASAQNGLDIKDAWIQLAV